MYKITILVLVGIIAGLLLGNFFPFYSNQTGDASSQVQAKTDGSDIQARLLALENQLTEEIGRRSEMELMLMELASSNASAPLPTSTSQSSTSRQPRIMFNEEGVPLDNPEQMRERFQQIENNARRMINQARDPQARISRLEQAGFSNDRAKWLIEREEEMRLESLYEDWEQRRQETQQNNSNRTSVTDKIKSELGEEGYEKYLQANDRPTSVRVDDIIEQSPAAMAGLKPGDEIISYNGERVYSIQDLNNSTVQGELGEPVVLTVKRDGVETRVSMERGPLGISSRSMQRGPAFRNAIRAERVE